MLDDEPKVLQFRIEYEPGMRFGDLVLIERDYQRNTFGYASNGYWRAHCLRCDTVCTVRTLALRRGWTSGRMCTACAARAGRARPLRFKQPVRCNGKLIGRLLVGNWVPRSGWICTCQECRRDLLVYPSRMLAVEGLKECRRPCGGPGI